VEWRRFVTCLSNERRRCIGVLITAYAGGCSCQHERRLKPASTAPWRVGWNACLVSTSDDAPSHAPPVSLLTNVLPPSFGMYVAVAVVAIDFVQIELINAAAFWVKKNLGPGSCNFRQTAANFRQRKLWVLRISVSCLNFPNMMIFWPQILYFYILFLTRIKFPDFP